ncbi:hypothetical protein V2J09_017452 [Rumex salicifolius]
MSQDPYPNHKLCGFLCTVLSASPEIRSDSKAIEFGTRCDSFSDGFPIGLRSESGIVLIPLTSSDSSLPENGNCESVIVEGREDEAIKMMMNKKKKKKGKQKKSAKGIEMKRSKAGIGQGSMSVIHHLHVLAMNKCLKIRARVVRVVTGQTEAKFRVVVLVDLYLPTQLWDGWQFPRSSSMAAAVFRHLSCDWGRRKLILDGNPDSYEYICEDDRNIWNIGFCHVLGCKQQCYSKDSSKRKLFELHEVFSSLPSLVNEEKTLCSSIMRDSVDSTTGIWDLSNDILANILVALSPLDLVRVSATCRHLRSLSASIMPCVKLKLYPHQQSAVEWMIRREQNTELIPHPLYSEFSTEDGFVFYLNMVSGEIITESRPMIKDFRGGMFCDEPGLGKTVSSLSLILKTQGTVADPPDGVQVNWCTQNGYQKCGYYECSDRESAGMSASAGKRSVGPNDRRTLFTMDELVPRKHSNWSTPKNEVYVSEISNCNREEPTTSAKPLGRLVRFTRSMSRVKKSLFHTVTEMSRGKSTGKRKSSLSRIDYTSSEEEDEDESPSECLVSRKKQRQGSEVQDVYSETWVQCDACQKWRRLCDGSLAHSGEVWFCSMNPDPLYQSCAVAEESWDYRSSVTYFPGFCDKSSEGLPQNVSFFASVLKENHASINCQTRKALTWLARLSPEKLVEMQTCGLVRAGLLSGRNALAFHKIFLAFGLVKKVTKGVARWFYPPTVKNLVFDLAALRVALCEPLGSFRMYLSRATLIVVPSNLVDHWKSQMKKHVRPGQLRVFVWTDHRKPSAHSLAWDYDVVITTFSRLSAEWGPNKKSVMRQVHWRRVMLDEGHTLGSSLSLTNKLQMAISLVASTRWLLTGTPTPNTPNTQLSQLQPMLKFLREEAYGHNQKSWEAGIIKPFEAEMEEGRSRLLQLLSRCMISARKSDMRCIPPCIKKKTYLDFTVEHAKSYNELVVTVRRNILLADWNDPSHVESLLNPKQWKSRANTIKNVRLSCCVAGHIKVTDAGDDIQETMDILVQDGLDPASEDHAYIRYSLMYGVDCQRCSQWCRLPIVTPCRHLLCLDCVGLDSEKCTLPGCGTSYEMQSPEILTRPENPHPKWPVPKDLIELQPSYKQDNWDPDWQSTSSSKAAYVIQRLKEIQDIDKQSAFSVGYDTGVVSSSSSCQKTSFLRWNNDSFSAPVQKVLIFSQFLEHVHVIEQQLAIAGIKYAGMYSPMQISDKMKSLTTFQLDADCMVLMMDGTAALGLDLSFVSHVFLMEPIWDKSMEEQVISRAHRMGATRPIHVETLAMIGTIEEQMLEFLENATEHRRLIKEEDGKSELHGARAPRSMHDFAERNYLAHLSTARTRSKSS